MESSSWKVSAESAGRAKVKRVVGWPAKETLGSAVRTWIPAAVAAEVIWDGRVALTERSRAAGMGFSRELDAEV